MLVWKRVCDGLLWLWRTVRLSVKNSLFLLLLTALGWLRHSIGCGCWATRFTRRFQILSARCFLRESDMQLVKGWVPVLITMVVAILIQTMGVVVFVLIVARWRFVAFVDTWRDIARILILLSSFLTSWRLQLVLIGVRRNYIATCFVFNWLTLDVCILEGNGLFEIIYLMLALAAISSHLVIGNHSLKQS